MSKPSKTSYVARAGDEARTRDVHLGKVGASRLKRSAPDVAPALILILVVSLFGLGFVTAAKPHKAPPKDQSTYERAVNTTLDTIMWVDGQHKGRMTWAELNAEVCRHMKVKRTEPWQRR